MNWPSLLLGFVVLGYGVYTGWARQARPHQFRKLEAMKEMWGDCGGYVLHVVGYTVAPILFGIWLILKGYLGMTAQ